MGNNRGFTLIEMMVTIAVLAVVAAIAAPSFVQMIATQQLNQATRLMAVGLSEARGRASAMRATVVVCPNKKADGSEITAKSCVETAISGADGNKYISQNRVVIVSIPNKANVDSTSAAKGAVITPTGTLDTSLNDITDTNRIKKFVFCSNGTSKVVSITILGAVSQSQGTC
jgi:type IV fimbrial biogenesis protein FimT/type IV fimbrial biogenesis protein FimU